MYVHLLSATPNSEASGRYWPLADPQIVELRVFRMTASEKSGSIASRISLE